MELLGGCLWGNDILEVSSSRVAPIPMHLCFLPLDTLLGPESLRQDHVRHLGRERTGSLMPRVRCGKWPNGQGPYVCTSMSPQCGSDACGHIMLSLTLGPSFQQPLHESAGIMGSLLFVLLPCPYPPYIFPVPALMTGPGCTF